MVHETCITVHRKRALALAECHKMSKIEEVFSGPHAILRRQAPSVLLGNQTTSVPPRRC